MKALRNFLLVSGLAMTVAFPAMAQQSQQAPATSQGQGSMMGQGQGGMGQGQGGMGQGGMGQGGMGQGGMGQGRGGMMGGGMMRGARMGQRGGGRCPMMGQRPGGMMMGRGMMFSSVPMMEGRLAYIKADLQITSAQEKAWNAYADAVRARHTTMQSVRSDMMKAMASGSALDRMDARAKALQSMADSLKALMPATQGLYAVLTDAQKKKADQLLGGRCSMM